jgi:hypothetical protein
LGEPLLAPEAMLGSLKEIEQDLGRASSERWAPRVIDLDLLWWPGREMRSAELRIPHPEILGRAFVLEPLCDLMPDAVFGDRSFREHAEKLARADLSDTVPVPESDYRVRYPELMGILNVTPGRPAQGWGTRRSGLASSLCSSA